jgi:hypothetical protein
MSHGDKPFGLRQVRLVNMAGTQYVDLPAARTLTFKERIENAELSGNDGIQSVVAFGKGVEWSLEDGGISLEAYAMLTGRTMVTEGASPNETHKVTGRAGDAMPYLKLCGKVISEDSNEDLHCYIYKAKVTAIEGQFADGQFWVTKCNGLGIDDGVNGAFDFIGEQTAGELPTS